MEPVKRIANTEYVEKSEDLSSTTQKTIVLPSQHDTLASAAPVPEEDVIYAGTFWSKIGDGLKYARATAMNLGAAALSVLHSDSSSDDEETGPLAVKNEPVESEASEGLAALAEEAASDNKIEADVGLTSEYKLPEDFFSKVIAKVHYKQRSKLSKESTELRSLATVKYIEYMERNLRVRSKVSKEESGIQVAADSISKTLKRVKIEQLDQ